MKSKKVLKGCLVTGLIFIILIIAALVLTPLLFKDKILEKVQTEINKNVNAEVKFDDFKLSLFNSFPNLTFELTNLQILGIGEFRRQKLASIKSVYADVDLMSAFKDTIQIKAVVIDNPVISAKITKSGKANWDIAKVAPNKKGSEQAKETAKFNIGMQRFEIKNAIVTFNDMQNKMNASIKGLNFLLKGGFTQDFSNIDIHFFLTTNFGIWCIISIMNFLLNI
jgi:uncharacterized protein involved in outer membrane biogenesis